MLKGLVAITTATVFLLPSIADASSCRTTRSGSRTTTHCSSPGSSSVHRSYWSGSRRVTYSSGHSLGGRSWSSHRRGWQDGRTWRSSTY